MSDVTPTEWVHYSGRGTGILLLPAARIDALLSDMNQNILIFRNWASFAQTKLSQFQTSKKHENN
jgi:hypothetical protein